MYRSKYGFSNIQEIDESLQKERLRIKKQFAETWGLKPVNYSNEINVFLNGAHKRYNIFESHNTDYTSCNDDHVSFWKGINGKVAVSQPYHLDEKMLEAITRRCHQQKFEVYISGGGWHFPGATALVMYRKQKK